MSGGDNKTMPISSWLIRNGAVIELKDSRGEKINRFEIIFNSKSAHLVRLYFLSCIFSPPVCRPASASRQGNDLFLDRRPCWSSIGKFISGSSSWWNTLIRITHLFRSSSSWFGHLIGTTKPTHPMPHNTPPPFTCVRVDFYPSIHPLLFTFQLTLSIPPTSEK